MARQGVGKLGVAVMAQTSNDRMKRLYTEVFRQAGIVPCLKAWWKTRKSKNAVAFFEALADQGFCIWYDGEKDTFHAVRVNR